METLVKPLFEGDGAIGGGFEGAERTSRETLRWTPRMQSPDNAINAVKEMADARSEDMVQNDGYASGSVMLHKDNIVGSQYRLNAKPNWRALGVSEEWAEEFQQVVEPRFNTLAESIDCWFDAAGKMTFTDQIRLTVGTFCLAGESLASVEWLKDQPRRPFKTAILEISPHRLSNPDNMPDDRFLRRGIRRDRFGRPLKYCIRDAHPYDITDLGRFQWKEVAAEKPWGRRQIIHIIEQRLPDQSRGISDMVSVLKQMRMTKNFQEITLQNAVVNATYAAAIESELPSADVFATIGAGQSANPVVSGVDAYLQYYLGALSGYLDSSKNIQMDGVKIPHLFPGTKLNLKPVGNPGGVGSDFEQSLLRYIAAPLGLSYEQFSRDYTRTNYSSARASMNETWKFMQSRKKVVADRKANNIYALWLEEEFARGNVPLPPGKPRDWFYEPGVKDFLVESDWIGASRGQIDELKETKSALARIDGGLSTYEKECARLGEDFRRVFEQRARENKIMSELSLSFNTSEKKPQVEASEQETKAEAENTQEEDEEEL